MGALSKLKHPARWLVVSTRVQWVLWIATRAYGMAALHGVFPYNRTQSSDTDVRLYWLWAYGLWHGVVPYVTRFPFPIVYPPGVLPFLALPPISPGVYLVEFVLLGLLVDAWVLHALQQSTRSFGAALWVIAAPLLGPIFWSRFDIFVAGVLVAGLIAFERGRYSLSALWITFAALIKLWPALLVVMWFRFVPRTRRRGYIVATGLVLYAVFGPLLALGATTGLWAVARAQSGRGVEIESLYALPLYVVHALGGHTPIVKELSLEFTGHLDSSIAVATNALLLLAAAYCVWRVMKRGWTTLTPAASTLLVATLIILTDRVLSPQYMIWMAAAVCLFIDECACRRQLAVATAALLAATQLQFPFEFRQLMYDTSTALPISALHAAVLLGFCVVVLKLVHPRVDPEGVGMALTPPSEGALSVNVEGPSVDATRRGRGCPARARDGTVVHDL